MPPNRRPNLVVRGLVQTALVAIMESPLLGQATCQDALNTAASLLVTLAKFMETRMTPVEQFQFRDVLGAELHRLADGVLTGALLSDHERPERVH